MQSDTPPQRSIEELLSRALVEIVDNNAHMMTMLDLQARLLAKAEGRDVREVVREINEMLRARRREAISAIEIWATGSSTRFEDES